MSMHKNHKESARPMSVGHKVSTGVKGKIGMGHKMSDKDFEVGQHHKGKVDMLGGKLSKLSVSLGRNK